ncbi:preprotein translocase subunit SecA [Mesomycoplasma conjunctivae]|uniref:Protein translocase subunit SecA n=1 Tax=Mesomycoplasma conjunctivae (strain ATCC 25834 / NCTC 10147 / HRC/581) TaxID=572263 RepID=C5J6Z8_MESCH|nr:preprotein translocase subunit SecA [Mesomycoplasma conjunctivae]CAT05261.1 Protein translocase subunit secA [Mesomycoplasma conjunctivae]VEU66490.1 preprotein translocase subunit SecA [Mesomycoplasma conjunctivae]
MKSATNFFTMSSEMRLAYRLLKQINNKRAYYAAMSDDQLANQTYELKLRLSRGEKHEDIRVDAFAVAREATKRVLNKYPYDVQILGGLILDMGSVAEMKTGEGKTIAAIAPVYLNALKGEGVIVSTVNEYLAERDAADNGKVFNFLGLSVGVNRAGMDSRTKKIMYSADITYSIHSELGFDYLRDNMVFNKEEKVQRSLNFCLLDEIDSILIDEAKTPLIISGGQQLNPGDYYSANQFVQTLVDDDFYVDEETKGIKLNDQGIDKANAFFKTKNLYEIGNSELVHRIQNALRANKVMKKDVEYIVLDDKIELVDQFTGRIMQGRSYSEGLQQALQAKENLEIEPETKTLATITYQNFFRLFKKLSGMTGTAKTEEQEFIDVYNMRVNVIPTNKPIARLDDSDLIFGTLHAKNQAIIAEVERVHKKGQPILIGTSQVADSETLSDMLRERGLSHTVLNAKQNEYEAEIISKAGVKNAITIATNMAGRGTDIKLDSEVIDLGGLYILGTDKAESRRIDNQLRGRSGRQGDIGYSRFYISIEDPLLRRFSNFEQIQQVYGSDKSLEPIKGKFIKKTLINAQKKIEGFNFDMRKSVLSYDDVIRQQRDLIYTQRNILLESDNFDHYIKRMIIRTVDIILGFDFISLPNQEIHYTNLVNYLNDNLSRITHYDFSELKLYNYPYDEVAKVIIEQLETIYFEQLQPQLKENLGETYYENERYIILSSLDHYWQSHIDTIDKLRSSANLVQYSQKNPYQIFIEESTKKFNILISESANQAIVSLFNNENARKIVYNEYTLSNGQILSFAEDTPIELIEQIIKNNEERIEHEKQLAIYNSDEFIYKQLEDLNIKLVQDDLESDFQIFALSSGKQIQIKRSFSLTDKRTILVSMNEDELKNQLENDNQNSSLDSQQLSSELSQPEDLSNQNSFTEKSVYEIEQENLANFANPNFSEVNENNLQAPVEQNFDDEIETFFNQNEKEKQQNSYKNIDNLSDLDNRDIF